MRLIRDLKRLNGENLLRIGWVMGNMVKRLDGAFDLRK